MDPIERKDPPLHRKRIKHAVPLGSIFVWSTESVIMSGMLLVGTLFISSGASDSKINIVDSTVSFTLLACSAVTMFGHFIVAHAFGRESMAEWAGGLHSAFSNSYCTVCFLCLGTYVALYVDSCLLQLPSKDMCTLFFRNSPFADIVVGVFSAFILVIFLASMALSFVSSPQHLPSYAFVSKGTLMMSATLFGWVAPVGKSNFGRYGCQDTNPPALGIEPLWIFCILLGLSVGMGVASLVVEWVCGGIYEQASGTKWATMVPHIVIDILVFLVSCMIPLPLFLGNRQDVGSMGVGFCLGISSIVGIWSLVDFSMALIFASGCWRPWVVIPPPPLPHILPEGVPVPLDPGKPIALTRAPIMTMYMADGGSTLYGGMKKADSMPPSLRQTLDNDDGSMANVFVQDDVRRSLRQRAPPFLASS